MRALLATLAFLGFFAPAFAESAPAPKADNTVCICGKVVDAKSPTVTLKIGDKEVTYRVCSKECADAIKKMKPEDARKAIEGHKRDKGDGE